MITWVCPLNGKICSEIHVIGIDGGLRHTSSLLLNDLIERGWRRVDFPKRSYYAEHDTKHPAYQEREIINFNEDTDVLPMERI